VSYTDPIVFHGYTCSNGGGVGSLSKLAETAEERAARKAAKEAKKIAQVFGYTNDSNPFGDSNLHEQFIWRKKEQGGGGGGGGGSSSSSSKKDRSKVEESQRRLELVKEIEKVRKRREDRERELEEQERLRAEEVSRTHAYRFTNPQIVIGMNTLSEKRFRARMHDGPHPPQKAC